MALTFSIALGIESNGPFSKKLYKWFDVFFNEIQVDRNIARKLEKHLASAGFIDIDKQSVAIPLGEWCSTECMYILLIYIECII
jgi:hypothetical protein